MQKNNSKQNYIDQYFPVAIAFVTALVAELLFQPFITTDDWRISFFRVLIVFVALALVTSYSKKSMLRFRPSIKDLILINLVLVLSIFILWFGQILTLALSGYLNDFSNFKFLSEQSLRFIIPFTFGSMLITTVRGLNYGLVLSISFALIAGFYLPNDFLIIPYTFITSLVACNSINDLRTRGMYLKAGIKVGIFAIPFSLFPLLFVSDIHFIEIFFRLITPIIGGILAAALSAALTPLLEYLGGYVTDLKLIEISTLDHPLLKMLSIQAPGTWNHSMVLGMMVESAADAIGANSVLSRVGAYFHDIGKAKKPLYFIENQKHAENRHDRLSPSMSSLIIRAHVKDGVEMAKEHKLPSDIIDLIQQHHGTSMIEYFYKKACAEAEESEDGQDVDKSLYTYPGPKPQTREAGILMLADVIESSSRTLPDLSLDRIQKHVQTMINRVFSSGQLEECDLTLRDLHKIARCFIRVLNGIYHQRIAYDEADDKSRATKEFNVKDLKNNPKNEQNNKATGKNLESDSANKLPSTEPGQRSTEQNGQDLKGKDSTNPKNQNNNPEDLKRLGVEEYT